MKNRMKIADQKYEATAKNKAKSTENQRHYHNTHTTGEGFKQKSRESADAFYATNEAYRLNRQDKARQR